MRAQELAAEFGFEADSNTYAAMPQFSCQDPKRVTENNIVSHEFTIIHLSSQNIPFLIPRKTLQLNPTQLTACHSLTHDTQITEVQAIHSLL